MEKGEERHGENTVRRKTEVVVIATTFRQAEEQFICGCSQVSRSISIYAICKTGKNDKMLYYINDSTTSHAFKRQKHRSIISAQKQCDFTNYFQRSQIKNDLYFRFFFKFF